MDHLKRLAGKEKTAATMIQASLRGYKGIRSSIKGWVKVHTIAGTLFLLNFSNVNIFVLFLYYSLRSTEVDETTRLIKQKEK